MNKTNYSEKEIYNLIAGIPDPEIPVITIEDLGILREVSIKDDKILISITPTYTVCPAQAVLLHQFYFRQEPLFLSHLLR